MNASRRNFLSNSLVRQFSTITCIGGCLAAFLLGLATPARAQIMVDLNHNGMSDIWELIYNAGGLNPTNDDDGDGASNLQEAIAGTDPLNSNSVPKMNAFAYTNGGFSVTIPCELGKQYQLQSITNMGLTNWLMETNVVVRKGTFLTLGVTNSSVMKFFRIAIADVDTDGDGVNDWEEYQLGLDPLNPLSNGQVGNNGQALTDYQYVTGQLAQQNVINIVASDATASQPDPGQTATATGMYTITRGGFPLTSITVYLNVGGPGPGYAVEGVDHMTLPGSIPFPVGTSSQTVTLTPLANTNLAAPVIAMLQVTPGTGYTPGQYSNASVVIYPSATGFGTGLTGYYYTNSNPTYTSNVNFNPTNLVFVRIDTNINFTWGTTTNPITNSSGHYCVRWVGQVQPQYSETYYFDAYTDDGVVLYVNDQVVVSNWSAKGASDSIGTINLKAGVKYDLRLDYFQSTSSAAAQLYWYSADQSRQIIPPACFYPSNSAYAPTAITSPLTAVAFVGQYFSFTNTAANSPSKFTANGLPPGLSFNTTNGVISGTPTVAGDFQVTLTATNKVSLGASALTIEVFGNVANVVDEIWTGIAGTNVTDIPTTTAANVTNLLSTLEGISNYGDNYGERIRGYFTAPATGNYYFWIAGSDSAQLWISNDGESVNKVLRAWVNPSANPAPPPNYGTASRQWNLQTNQQSGWLTLVAGQQYYLEILHKAGVGANDNWSVGWLQDPTGTNTVPGGVVPGYLLSPYYPLPITSTPGTLYVANMLEVPGVSSTASGSATLLVSADGTEATLKFSVNNLTSAISDERLNSDPYLAAPGELVFDITATASQPDGSYQWVFQPVGPLQPADILELIREGKLSIGIETANYPAGEISGHFTLANGSQVFNPPPAPPAWTDDSGNSNAAARFLIQATFGPSPSDIALVQSMGYSNWLSYQFSLPVSHHLPIVMGNTNSDPTQPYPSSLMFNTWWQQSITAPDQLRQRVAFALSEIMVVSENGALANYYANSLSSYYDRLLDNSFGNYRSLLESVTLAPAMGLYLNMEGNSKGSIVTGLHANENYGREVMQLFSIGLNRLWPDGTLVMNSQGQLVPTYTQNNVMGMAQVFTGWAYYQTNQANGRLPTSFYPASNLTNSMVLVPLYHDLNNKLVLDNVVLPAGQGLQTNTTLTNFDYYCSQDLEAGLNSIFNNQNVGPFICRELIQRLVTSNPSRDYIYRVTQVFNNDGTGVRGNLQAVVQSILLDYEARSPVAAAGTTYGKLREPMLRITAPARAFPAPPTNSGTYTQSGSMSITVNTATPHLMNSGDTALLSFVDTSGQPAPENQGYSVTVTATNAFTVGMPGVLSGSYTQTNSLLTLALNGHGLLATNSCYVEFTTGGALSGVYVVQTVVDANHFTVTALDSANRSGVALMPKFTGGGFVVANRTNMTVSTALPNGMAAGNNVYLAFTQSGSPASGQYQIANILDATRFQIFIPTNNNQTQDGLTVYPLSPPNLSRSGTVVVQESTWNMGYTDSGSASSLSQTPLRSPTVFNFYFPTYAFPGALAAAGLTTPEFQLTSDSATAEQINFIEGGLLNNTGNTNGLNSFASGNGSIVMDIAPWMTTNYTSAAGIPGLVDALNTLLVGGGLSPSAKTAIVSYVNNTTNFPTNSTTLARDKVRAVIHQIVCSPDFSIQR